MIQLFPQATYELSNAHFKETRQGQVNFWYPYYCTNEYCTNDNGYLKHTTFDQHLPVQKVPFTCFRSPILSLSKRLTTLRLDGKLTQPISGRTSQVSTEHCGLL